MIPEWSGDEVSQLGKLKFWERLFFSIGTKAELSADRCFWGAQFDPPFILYEKLIQYQYNFIQLRNKLFTIG